MTTRMADGCRLRASGALASLAVAPVVSGGGEAGLSAAQGGATVIRPTVTGDRFSCDRLAQSSSSTSIGVTSNCAASARCAPSRSVVRRRRCAPTARALRARSGRSRRRSPAKSRERRSARRAPGTASRDLRSSVSPCDPVPSVRSVPSYPNISLTRSNRFRSSCSSSPRARGSNLSLGSALASSSISFR